jgi:N6-adenosine-specific RNA methylase IME4
MPHNAPPQSNDQFDVIYADPPWRYGSPKAEPPNRRIENHYPTMPLGDICALRVPAAKDAVLYLWATAPLLPEALQVMEAWGFRYKSCAIWDKQRVGIGHWWRGQHELLLVGVRGKARPPQSTLRRSSVFRAPRGRHSEKPAEVRDYIAQAFPAARRLEMFARVTSPGWKAWGNEVACDVEIAA